MNHRIASPDAGRFDLKQCTKCGETKPRSDFNMHDSKRGLRHSWCRDCTTQAMRQWRGPTKPRTRPILERFWEKVNKTDSCWLWTGGCGASGYGHIWNGAKHETTHRFSYRLHVGEIPHGLNVCHKCDVRNCVRPDHLFLGTDSDNRNDALSKKRWKVKNFDRFITKRWFIRGLEFSTIRAAAEHFGVSQITVQRWVGMHKGRKARSDCYGERLK